jgi:hypothetical protein
MELDKELIDQIKITPILDTLKLEDIDDDTYFSQYKGEYISNSRLGKLVKEGVDAFFKNEDSPYNPSFETGSLIHQQVLQPESFYVVPEVFKPTAKAGLMADALYKPDGTISTDDEIKAQSYIIGYYKDKLTSNRLSEFRQKAEPYWRDRYLYEQNNPIEKDDTRKRIYTDERNFELLTNCLRTLEENKDIQKLLHPTGIVDDPIIGNEKTILMDIKMEVPGYESRVYKLKAKLDNFSIDTEENIITVNDLKTTSRPAVQFDPTYFSYQREIAFYSYLLKIVANKYYNIEKPTIKGNFLVVSTIPEYNTLVYPMTPKLFKSGMAEVSYLLKTVAYFNQVKGYEF